MLQSKVYNHLSNNLSLLMKLFLLQIALVTFKNTVKFQKSGNGISRPPQLDVFA